MKNGATTDIKEHVPIVYWLRNACMVDRCVCIIWLAMNDPPLVVWEY